MVHIYFQDIRTRCKIKSELGLAVHDYSSSKLTKQVLLELFMAGNVGGDMTYRAFLTDQEGTRCEQQWVSLSEDIRKASSAFNYFSPTTLELRTAAFLVEENFLDEVKQVKLHHLDLGQIPSRSLTALLKTVDNLLDLRNVSNLIDILSGENFF